MTVVDVRLLRCGSSFTGGLLISGHIKLITFWPLESSSYGHQSAGYCFLHAAEEFRFEEEPTERQIEAAKFEGWDTMVMMTRKERRCAADACCR